MGAGQGLILRLSCDTNAIPVGKVGIRISTVVIGVNSKYP